MKAAKTPAEKLSVAQAHADWSIPALYVFLGGYVVMALVTWFFYIRSTPAAARDAPEATPAVI